MQHVFKLKNKRLNNRDLNIDQNNRDYDVSHNRAALCVIHSLLIYHLNLSDSDAFELFIYFSFSVVSIVNRQPSEGNIMASGYLGDAKDHVDGGGQRVDGALQLTAHHLGQSQGHRLAQHHRLSLDSPHTCTGELSVTRLTELYTRELMGRGKLLGGATVRH